MRKTPFGDVSVPINIAYNHHFESTMLGADARMIKVPFDHPEVARQHGMAAGGHGHGHPDTDGAWVVEDVAGPASRGGLPASQSFGAANGGEYR